MNCRDGDGCRNGGCVDHSHRRGRSDHCRSRSDGDGGSRNRYTRYGNIYVRTANRNWVTPTDRDHQGLRTIHKYDSILAGGGGKH